MRGISGSLWETTLYFRWCLIDAYFLQAVCIWFVLGYASLTLNVDLNPFWTLSDFKHGGKVTWHLKQNTILLLFFFFFFFCAWHHKKTKSSTSYNIIQPPLFSLLLVRVYDNRSSSVKCSDAVWFTRHAGLDKPVAKLCYVVSESLIQPEVERGG